MLVKNICIFNAVLWLGSIPTQKEYGHEFSASISILILQKINEKMTFFSNDVQHGITGKTLVY